MHKWRVVLHTWWGVELVSSCYCIHTCRYWVLPWMFAMVRGWHARLAFHNKAYFMHVEASGCNGMRSTRRSCRPFGVRATNSLWYCSYVSGLIMIRSGSRDSCLYKLYEYTCISEHVRTHTHTYKQIYDIYLFCFDPSLKCTCSFPHPSAVALQSKHNW